MATLTQPKRIRSMGERYEMLRKTLAHYLLLQVGTFVTAAGFDAIAPAMNILTDMKANLKVRKSKVRNKRTGLRLFPRILLTVWARPSIATMKFEPMVGSGTVW